MMATEPTTTEGTRVVLLRPGVGRQDFVLTPGSTLADLIREAKAEAEQQEIMVDGRPLEESLILQPGMIVSLAPRPKNAGLSEAWRETIGMFRGNAAFRELAESVEASREAEKDRS
jgi:hypothetical protein